MSTVSGIIDSIISGALISFVIYLLFFSSFFDKMDKDVDESTTSVVSKRSGEPEFPARYIRDKDGKIIDFIPSPIHGVSKK